jgi:hypothetical protein
MSLPVASSKFNALKLFNDGQHTLAAMQLRSGTNMLHLTKGFQIGRKRHCFDSLAPHRRAGPIEPGKQVASTPSAIRQFNGETHCFDSADRRCSSKLTKRRATKWAESQGLTSNELAQGDRSHSLQVSPKALGGQVVIVTNASNFACSMGGNPESVDAHHAASALERRGKRLPLRHGAHENEIFKQVAEFIVAAHFGLDLLK